MYSTPKITTKTAKQALASLERTCSKMERAVSDARRSLYRWGITESDEQDAIIAKLIKDGFINERRYASAYVRDKLIGGRWGVAKIRAGLRAKSIDRELIEEAIENNTDKKEIKRKLTQNIRRHWEREHEKAASTYALRVKLFRRAASQGFDIEMINEIIEGILYE